MSKTKIYEQALDLKDAPPGMATVRLKAVLPVAAGVKILGIIAEYEERRAAEAKNTDA
jgi:hypothetical protein